MSGRPSGWRIPQTNVDVVGPAGRALRGWTPFVFKRDFDFSTTGLESYALSAWEDVIFDAMVVAAAVEYADSVSRRWRSHWARRLSIRIPVHDPDRWGAPAVSNALHDALGFVTGDRWSIQFVRRRCCPGAAPERYLSLPVQTEAVQAYSDGMDSLAVAGILRAKLGDRLVRVRVGGKRPSGTKRGDAFTAVPYRVVVKRSNREPTARSRGFKFALIAGIAAYLTGARRVVFPESGQGALGPRLVNVGDSYPDYRNHPLFTRRMEQFLRALLHTDIEYEFPRLWNTKGETLAEFVALGDDGSWRTTKSCWRNNRWSSVNGSWRNCGICAACMLRRVSVYAAGLSEAPDTYVCTDMRAETLERAVDPDFTRMTGAYRDYGIAGVLHMDHLAAMARRDFRPFVARHASLLARPLGHSRHQTQELLQQLLDRHAEEWSRYLGSLGAHSFVRQLVRGNR